MKFIIMADIFHACSNLIDSLSVKNENVAENKAK